MGNAAHDADIEKRYYTRVETVLLIFFSREEVRAPKVLYNRKALRHVLQDWIPVLHNALTSCNETSPSQSPGLCLKNWLNETLYTDVCMLTKMCLDTGVYGETEDQTRDQKEYSRDTSALGRTEVKEKETFSRHGDSTTDVMTRDQELCSNDTKTLESDVRDTRETTTYDEPQSRGQESGRDSRDVITGDNEHSCDGHPVDMDSSRECSQGQNSEQEKSKSALPSITYDRYIEGKSEWTCESCSKISDSFIKHTSHVTNEAEVDKKRDWVRACFIRRYFGLLRVKDIRRTLGLASGYKHSSWSMLLQSIKGL